MTRHVDGQRCTCPTIGPPSFRCNVDEHRRIAAQNERQLDRAFAEGFLAQAERDIARRRPR